MNQYVTGSMIRKIREEKKMTQAELAEKLMVSDKAISKWETGRGYPDITLIEPLAAALGISTIELLSGNDITNQNRSASMLRTKVYVCPICGNVITASGECVLSCCGVSLQPLEAEKADEAHQPVIERVEDEYFLHFDHPMTKKHYLSFVLALTSSGTELFKLYPEGAAEARIKVRGVRKVYAYCNQHGLFEVKIK